MIELGKQYKTRDGREAQVFALDNAGDYPVVGRVKKTADDMAMPKRIACIQVSFTEGEGL